MSVEASTSRRADALVIGGGIVGLATAYALVKMGRRVIVLEKETRVAAHQSGRNSGVIHSGIYYRPGSLKAENCREGKKRLIEFCQEEGVTYEMCGKVIVAAEERERPGLFHILDKGKANGIECRLISPAELKEVEPHAVGVAAIHVPEAGIVDYKGVCDRLADKVREHDGEIVLDAEVVELRETAWGMVAETTAGVFEAAVGVNCAGLYSDRIARMSGFEPDVRIVPFRGEYYELVEERRHLCRNLIYPVHDPNFPFLGVHATRMHDGRVECGPSAVLALAREGYSWKDINVGELGEALTYPGLVRMLMRHWRKGMLEIRQSFSKAYYTKTLQRLIPEIREEDLVPAPSGVRAQAISRDGSLVDDFYVVANGHYVHVLNAASPAATSALNVGEYIAEHVRERWM
jgi:(S)-2-hydroxyglutarate dehydrogenase